MAEEAAPAAAEAAPAPAAEGAPPAEGEAPAPPAEDGWYPPPPKWDPSRKLVFRHWIRPTFLNYHYIYDYRHNYYDDVIDFLDRRQRGLTRDPPRPQTWAERALRTYTFKPNPGEFGYYASYKKEVDHNYKVAHTYRADHTMDYFRRKFKSVLY